MTVPKYHADKRIYALLLLIVAMLIGMYVVNFKKITTGSQAANSANDKCIRTYGTGAYCNLGFGLNKCRSGYTYQLLSCGFNMGKCCSSNNGVDLNGNFLDSQCKRSSGQPTAYCNTSGVGRALVGCGDGFIPKHFGCGGVFDCCVPSTTTVPTFTPTPTPTPLTGAVVRPIIPRPTAGTITANGVCPPPTVTGGVKTCQTQGYRWGPDQNGAKTCYAICGNLYSSYCGNAKLVDNNGNNVTPCCEEALSKPFLFSKVCCDKLNPTDIKSALGESAAKQTCPAQFP